MKLSSGLQLVNIYDLCTIANINFSLCFRVVYSLQDNKNICTTISEGVSDMT